MLEKNSRAFQTNAMQKSQYLKQNKAELLSGNRVPSLSLATPSPQP